jgi:hypothetical protein
MAADSADKSKRTGQSIRASEEGREEEYEEQIENAVHTPNP